MKKSMIALFLFVSATANAAETIGQAKIKSLMNAYDGWLINLDIEDNNPLDCAKNTMILQGSHSQHDALYSYILAAYTTGKNVLVYTNKCDDNGYVEINNIYSDWGK